MENSRISSQSPDKEQVVEAEEAVFLRFEIEDMGIGMSDEAMQSLFSPFKQNQRLAGGTGLGLFSLAKRIDALKARYGVMKRRDGNQGSLFWFTIPYKPDKATAAIMAQGVKYKWSNLVTRSVSSTMMQDIENDTMRTNEESIVDAVSVAPTVVPNITFTAEEYATKSHKDCWEILIVDDAPSIVKMTTMMLKKLGHKISSAENGEIAVRKVTNLWETSQQQYDVILMDLQMPVLDGLEATRRIRSWESDLSKKKQFIIGVSANSDSDTLEAAEIAGVDTFMAKPFDVTTFYERLKQCSNVGEP